MALDWRKLEKTLMQSLGLKATPLSGGGWLAKEDGESDKVLAQLKGTAGKSISIKHQDLIDLIRHSRVARKLPAFVLYFVGDEPYVLVRAGDLQKAARYIKYGEFRNGTESSSTGKRRASNPPNPVPVRRTVDKTVRGNDNPIPNRRGVSTLRSASINRSRPGSSRSNSDKGK
jgi:hypothetical protein